MNKHHLLSRKEQIFFVRQLTFLLRSGMPITECIETLKYESRSGATQKLLTSLYEKIMNGKTLGESLSNSTPTLPLFAIRLIENSEERGTLARDLEHLGNELETAHALKQKIISALIYPLVVGAGAFCIIMLLVLMIFPKITPLFLSMRIELPYTTQLLLTLSNTLTLHGLKILLGLAAITFIFTYTLRLSTRAKNISEKILIVLPIVGPLLKRYYVSQTFRALGLMLESGSTLSDALKITEETTPHSIYRAAYGTIREKIMEGKNCSDAFKTFPSLFPSLSTATIGAGEKSGTLPQAFLSTATFYAKELETYLLRLTHAVEPILMIVVGIVVGFIALSIITPMYEITSHIRR